MRRRPHPRSRAAQPAVDPSQLFGVRESVEQIDISPDGRHVVFLQPGRAGRRASSSTTSQRRRAAPRSSVRRRSRALPLVQFRHQRPADLPDQRHERRRRACSIPFSRLVVARHRRPESDDARPARARSTTRGCASSTARSSIGPAARHGSMLMARDYVPEAGRTGTRLAAPADGLGVDRVDVRTLRSTRVEPPNRARRRLYHRRPRQCPDHVDAQEMRGSTGQARHPRSTISTAPRPAATGAAFASYDTSAGRGHVSRSRSIRSSTPLMCFRSSTAASPSTGSSSTARWRASWSMPTSGSTSTTSSGRAGGARVIGVTFADEQRRIVYFDRAYAALARIALRAPSPICR